MPDDKQRFRLVTRSDFDGLACGVLLKELDLITEIKFVHPKDMQDGLIEISDSDITTNLPYVEGVHLAFDHHLSEMVRNEQQKNYIIFPDAPSAARVVIPLPSHSRTFWSRTIGISSISSWMHGRAWVDSGTSGSPTTSS